MFIIQLNKKCWHISPQKGNTNWRKTVWILVIEVSSEARVAMKRENESGRKDE